MVLKKYKFLYFFILLLIIKCSSIFLIVQGPNFTLAPLYIHSKFDIWVICLCASKFINFTFAILTIQLTAFDKYFFLRK